MFINQRVIASHGQIELNGKERQQNSFRKIATNKSYWNNEPYEYEDVL